MGNLNLPPRAAEPTRHRICVTELEQMAAAGIFAEDDRIELIEGDLIEMAPIGSYHAGIVNQLMAQLHPTARNAVLTVQNPLQLSDLSEPEPDLMLLRYRDDFYRHAHPTAADVLLLIEVSDTTARFDREVKLPLYAEHGVVEVWLIDLPHQALECYRQPLTEERRYGELRRITQGAITPETQPHITLQVDTLWAT